jgi:hypothetical protein
MITDYRIIQSIDPEQVSRDVLELLGSSMQWHLHGTLVISSYVSRGPHDESFESTIFAQALIRVE